MAAKKCLICSSAFVGRADAKTCSPRCRKRLQQVRFTLSGRSSSRFSKAVVLAVLGLFGFLSILLGSVPHQAVAANTASTLNFQARLLTPAGGVVPDGLYNIRFKIYDGGTQGGASGTGQANSGTGGTYLWTESYYDTNGVTAGNDFRVNVINGYFSVNLGSQTALSGINWDQELWMTMDIGGTTQTATPTYDGEMTNSNARIKLTGVPYAFSAGQIAKTSGSNRGTLSFNTVANNPNITLPDETGTVCTTAAAGVCTVAGTGFVQLQSATPGTQQTGSFNVSGTGIAGTLQTATLQAAAASSLTITGNASSTWTTSSGNLSIATNGSNGILNLQTSSNNNTTVQIGNTASAIAQTINIGNNTTASSTDNVTIGNLLGTSTTTINAGTGNLNLTTNNASASIIAKSQTNSNTALQVQNASSASILTISTSAPTAATPNLTLSGTSTFQQTTAANSVTASGNEITDTTRTTNTQGDGRAAPDSSYGVWESTTNMLTNGGFESNSTGWTNSGAGATVSRDTTQSKFGSASAKVIMDGTATQGISSGSSFTTISPATAYTASGWVKGPSGSTLWVSMQERDSGHSNVQFDTASVTTLTGNWQKISWTFTSNASAAEVAYRVLTNVNQAYTFWLDGAQLEQKTFATPYVETNGGTAARSNARVQAPSSALTATQGWVAIRGRFGFASAQASGQRAFYLSDGSISNRISGTFQPAALQINENLNGGSTETQAITIPAWSVGDTYTAVLAWTSTNLYLSYNGGAFTSYSRTTIPTGITTLDIGSAQGTATHLDGDIFWFTTGTGTLTDADAAAINAKGNADPDLTFFKGTDLSSLPTLVWKANNANYQDKLVASVQNSSGFALLNIDVADSSVLLPNATTASAALILGGDANLYRSAAQQLTTNASLLIRPSTDSTTALKVSSSDSTQLLDVDTTNKAVYIGVTGSTIASSTIHIADTSGNATQAVTIGSNGNASNVVTIDAGTGASAIQIGNSATTHGIQIGTGAAAQTIVIGSTNSSSATTINAGTGNLNLNTNSASASIIAKSSTNSTAAFQIQNSAGDQIINVDTTNTNLLLNSGGEQAPTSNDWQVLGSSTLTQDTAKPFVGSYALKIVTTTAAGDGLKQNITLSNNTQYTLQAMLQTASGGFSTLTPGYYDGTTQNDCTLSPGASNIGSSAWRLFSCVFTTPASHSNTPYIYFRQTDTVSHNLLLDNVQLKQASATSAYQNGTISLNGVITSPVIFKNQSNSIDNVFAVQNAAGTNALTVNTSTLTTSFGGDLSLASNTSVRSGSSGAAITFATGGGSSGNITIDTSLSNGSAKDIVLKSGGTTRVQTSGGVDVLTIANAGATTFKNSADSSAAFLVQNLAGNNYIAVDTSGANLNLGNGGIASTIQIGNTTGAVAQTIGIGNNATGSSTTALTIGNLLGSSTTTIQGGSGITLSNNITASGTYNSNTFTSTALTFGGASGTVSSGSGGLTLQAASGTVTLGTSTNLTAAAGLTIASGGSSDLTLNSLSGTLKTGSSTSAILFTNAGAASIDATSAQNLNLGTSNNAHTTTLGSTNASAGTTIQGGNGITLSNNTSVAAGKNFSLASGAGNFDAQNSTGTFDTSTGINTLRGDTTVTGTKTFSVTGGLTTLGAGLTTTGAATFNSNSATGFVVNNSSSGKAVATIDTSGNQLILGTSGASGITGALKFNFSGQTGSIVLDANTPSSTAYTIHLPAANGTVCLQSSSSCGFLIGSGTAFVQSGNSFGTTATLGTTDANGINIITNSHTVASLSSTGAANFVNFSDSQAAFQVQTAGGSDMFNINTTDGYVINNGASAPGNEIENPSFEAGAGISSDSTGWYTPAAGQAITVSAANARTGNNELQVTGNSSTHSIYTKYFAVHPGDTIYTEAFVKNSGGANGDGGIYLEFTDKDKGGNTYSTADTGLPGTSYVAKTITTTVPAGKTFVRVAASVRATSTTGTFYFDDFYLKKVNEQAPLLITNVSTTAFQVQNSSNLTVLGVDSTNSKIYTTIADGVSAIGFTLNTPSYTTSGAKLFSLQNNSAEKFYIDKDGKIVNQAAIQAGGNISTGAGGQFQINGTQISSSDLSNNSNLAKLDSGGNNPQIFTGNNKFTGTILSQVASATAFQVQNASNNEIFTVDATGSQIVLGKASTLTGAIKFFGAGGAGYLTLVGPTTPDTGNYTLTIPTITANDTICTNGTRASSCSNYAPSSGSGSYIQNQIAGQQSSSNFWISGTGRADTSFTTPSVDATAASGTIALGNINATTINIGSASTATTTIGGGNVAHTIHIADAGTSSTQNVTIGSAGTNAGNLLVQVGTGALQLQGQNGSSIGIGNNSNNQTLTIGNTTGATALNLYTGTGNFILDGVAGTTYTLGASTTTGTFTIGGTAQTGGLTLGQSTASNTITLGASIGNGNTQTLNVGTSATSGSTTNLNIGSDQGGTTIINSPAVTIGTTGSTGAITLGRSTANNTITIGASAGNGNTQTINIGSSGTVGSTTNLVLGSTIAGTTKLQSAGGLVFSGITTDITTGSNENLTIVPNGSGFTLFNEDADTNVQFTATAAPGLDMLAISNSGQASTTTGVDGLSVTFGSSNASGDGVHVAPSYAGGATDGLTYNGFELDAFSPSNGAGTDTINGIKLGALTDPGGTITSTALNIGAGWDTGISINGLAVFSGAGVLSTSTSVVTGSYTGITGTGALNAGSITSGFGDIDVGAGNYVRANTFDATTGVTLSIGNAVATGVDLCNTSPCVALNLGSASTATTTIGGGNVAHTINIGAGATSTNQGITIGSAGTNAGNLLIQVGTGSLQLQGQNNSSISIGNNSNNQTLTIGNTTGATALNLYTGTGNFILDGVAGSTYTLGASTTTGTFTVGGASQTGALTFGQYNGTSSSTINIGAALASAGTQAVNIATGSTGTGNVTIGNTGGGTTLIHSPTITATGTTINLNAATIATNQATVALLQSATALNVGSTSGTFTIRNGSLTIGTSAGSGVLINNGSTSNTTLALGDLAAGSIGSAASTVDIYTSISISPTASGRTYTIPSPTDGAVGRVLYISNINATNTFTIGSTLFNTHSTGTLVYDGTGWNFAGMDGGSNNYIQNQSSSDQTTANFRISGTGRANTRFTSPFFDSITGALGIGDTAATTITIGNTTNTTSIALQGAAAATYDIGTSTTTGTITIGKYNATGTSTINIGAALASAGTQNINLGTGGGGTNTIIIGSSNAGATTISSPTTNINSATISTSQATVGIFNTNATTATVLQAATSISIGSTTAGGTFTVRNPNQTFGNAAGSGTFTNNGATLNSTLALGDLAAGSIGANSATVDIYTSFSIAPTVAGRTYTIPTPTASTNYGRIIYISNIGAAGKYFIIGTASINPGATASLIWSNSNGTPSWQFAGADAGNLQGAYTNSTGGTTPEVKADSTRGAVDIQDADSALNASLLSVRSSNSSGLGAAIFDVQSANPITDITNNNVNNLVSNSSFEANATGWSKMGSTQIAVSQDTGQQYIGSGSLKVVTNATDASGTDGASFALTTSTLVTNTTYNLTLYAKAVNTSFSTFELGRADNGSTNTSCLTAQTVSATGWTQFSCTFTTGTTSSTPYIYVRQTDQIARTFYIDGVQLTRYSLLSNQYADQTFAAGDWQLKSSSAVSRDTSQNQAGAGTASVKVITAANTGSGVQHNITLNDSTRYYVSFYAKLDSGSTALSTMEAGYSSDGSTDNTVCITAQTVVSTGWTNYTCYLTTPSSHSNTPYFYVKGNVAAIKTFYVDNVLMSIGNPLGSYREGQVAVNGIINSPVVLQGQSNSTTAFQVQDASGANILVVDSVNRQLKIYENAGSTNYALIYYDSATTTANYTANSGTVAVGTGAGGISVVAGASSSITITANNTSVWKTNTGTLTLQSGSGSSDYLILSAGGSSQVQVSGSSVVKLGSSAGDPATCTAGALVYNSSTNKLRGCQGSSPTWNDVIATTPNIQSTYNAGTGSSPEVVLDTTRGAFDIQGDVAASVTDLLKVNEGGGLTVFNVSKTGNVTIQDNTGTPELATTNTAITIGSGSAHSTNPIVLVLDNYQPVTATAEPTEQDGAMYYDADDNTFRCGLNGYWQDCQINNIQSSYNLVDDFTGGGTTDGTIGNLNWGLASAASALTLAYNPTTVASHDHPGQLDMSSSTSGAISLLRMNKTTNSSQLQADDVIKASVYLDSNANNRTTVGWANWPGTPVTNQAPNNNSSSGAWLEAVPATNANWRYCYANNNTATCANSTVAIPNGGWNQLEIHIISSTAVDFYINGTLFQVTGVTMDIGGTNKLTPGIAFNVLTNSAKHIYVDYFNWYGTITTAGGR